MLLLKKKSYFFILFICLNVTSQQQLLNKIDLILQIGNSNEKFENKEKLDQLLILLSQSNELTKTKELGLLYAAIGKQYYNLNDNTKAIVYYKKAIQIQNKFKKENLFALNKTRSNLAWLYSYEGLNKERYLLLKKILEDKGNDKYTFQAGIDCAVLEANTGDFYTGIRSLNVMLAQQEDLEKELLIRTVIIGIYGKMYEDVFVSKKSADLQIIESHKERINQKFHSTTLSKDILYTAYNNLAIVYDAFGDLNTALELYTKVKNYYQKIEKDTFKELSVLNNIGLLYAKQKKYNLVNKVYNEIISKSDDISQKATAYDNLGYFLQKTTDEQKILYFKKAIQTILERKEASFKLPTLEEIRQSGYQQDILVYLVDLAYNYVEAYKKSNKKNYLYDAKATLYLIDEVVSLLRYESNSEQSKLFWIEKGVNTYMLAVEVCYFLNLPDEAFYFIEKNKALLLLESIKSLQTKLTFEIPNKVLEREYQLHYEVNELEKKFQQNPNNNSYKDRFSAKNEEFRVFIDSLQKEFPQYIHLKKDIEIISLKMVKDKYINKNSNFVTYIVNENDGYGIFCSEKEKIFYKIKDAAQLQKNLFQLKKYVTQPILDKLEIDNFKILGDATFQLLFPFHEAISKIKNKSLIVIPDGNLINFPFEILPIQEKTSLKNSFLINTVAVSYLQSFSVFENIKLKKNNAENSILIIAPQNFKDTKLQKLKFSDKIINEIDKINATRILTFNEATKENFYKYCNNFSIIHLNTHAGIDEVTKVPWITFANKKITLEELYGINNQAELVILDACKTNDGELISGEGIMNLSRGFFHNGSKSVMASLWNVNEKAGNEIIESFYVHLEKGYSKDKALQIAKVEYLKKHNFTNVLPYYWASFTITGSTDKIILKKYNQTFFIIITLLSFLIFLLFWFKRR
ncbi:conserved hypothetical protein [Flavobacterium sp. 9AF]|uniref:CHAT domain-containing protein n=1 Tax=Flavobacterium sp. 9AF TaxID=2653142 RepID=UPI0012F2A4C8|nr:CHAT domain-containing tetratricopeptide repeat protein [Flavobacterium sp. 9AF]VXB91764.1 conserved hypothetical protein [Flavobacterium sp. 9AF]